jgi:hypothetical protein
MFSGKMLQSVSFSEDVCITFSDLDDSLSMEFSFGILLCESWLFPNLENIRNVNEISNPARMLVYLIVVNFPYFLN